MTVQAVVENYEKIMDFIRDEISVSEHVKSEISIACDEILSNILNYSGANKIDVTVLDNEDRVEITFSDDGKEFNPLDKNDPDLSAEARENAIGGLGIFLVKKLMTSVFYDYSEGLNKLTLVKNKNN